ncbi:unnamed protein product [Larinioides sclopetarius]|uniref:Uncharacterized protein n=1 Tax=Larinioides sclopetarius TaxID=280406 RepID=A0AAV1ZZ19_9ARAC
MQVSWSPKSPRRTKEKRITFRLEDEGVGRDLGGRTGQELRLQVTVTNYRGVDWGREPLGERIPVLPQLKNYCCQHKAVKSGSGYRILLRWRAGLSCRTRDRDDHLREGELIRNSRLFHLGRKGNLHSNELWTHLGGRDVEIKFAVFSPGKVLLSEDGDLLLDKFGVSSSIKNFVQSNWGGETQNYQPSIKIPFSVHTPGSMDIIWTGGGWVEGLGHPLIEQDVYILSTERFARLPDKNMMKISDFDLFQRSSHYHNYADP